MYRGKNNCGIKYSVVWLTIFIRRCNFLFGVDRRRLEGICVGVGTGKKIKTKTTRTHAHASCNKKM